MKNFYLTGLYLLLVIIITTAGLLLGNVKILYLVLLFLGLIALVFQKFIHKEPIRDLGYKWPSAPPGLYMQYSSPCPQFSASQLLIFLPDGSTGNLQKPCTPP